MFNKFYQRELNTLINELNAFTDETLIWKTLPGVQNSAGNLSLHLIGNLNHFIGHILGKNDYTRDREAEFSLNGIPRNKMIDQIQETMVVIENVLTHLKTEELTIEFPIKLNNQQYRTDDFIQHLLIHLSYHIGQINYLRRIITAS